MALAKKPQGVFMAATFVDWNQPDKVISMQKKLRKRIKRKVKSTKVQNNRINTFSVSIVNFYKLPIVGRSFDRSVTEEKIREVFNEYAKTMNIHYQKELQYNGDSHIYNDAFKFLGLEELQNKLGEIQHSVVDKVENKLEEIVSNASVGIWNLPDSFEDQIILPDLVASFGKTSKDLDLTTLIDELLVANLARNFLPFSKEILEDAINEFTQLMAIIKKYDQYTRIHPKLKTMLRNFIGTISGLQESLKLFDREVSKIYTVSIDAFDYLHGLPSDQLKQWATVKNRELGGELNDLIKTLSLMISEIKPSLRILLTNDGDSNIEKYDLLLDKFMHIKAHAAGIRQWVYRFEDIPSFTTIENGIAYESVEDEIYLPKSSNSFIETTKLFKMFQRGNSSIYALRGVDLNIEKGEFVIVRGPSGAGKTTLLNLMAGLDEAGRGAVFFKGQNIMKLKDGKRSKLRRKNFSFIFQNYALIPHLTATENTKIPLDLGGLSKKFAAGIQELLDSVGIGEYSDHKPALLSGGQMQRLGIARALINMPSVIFADEPTGDLDEATSISVMELLKKYHEETGVTIVMVTHDEKIAKYGNREIFLRDGQIVDNLQE